MAESEVLGCFQLVPVGNPFKFSVVDSVIFQPPQKMHVRFFFMEHDSSYGFLYVLNHVPCNFIIVHTSFPLRSWSMAQYDDSGLRVFVLLCFCTVCCFYVLVLDQRLGGNIGGILVWFHKSQSIWFYLPERVVYMVSNVLGLSLNLGSNTSVLDFWLCWCSCALRFSDVPDLL
jgi:hypothetical protein